MSDEDVLAAYVDASRSQRDRESAFRELVDRYERRVFGICYRFFGDRATAEDAAQDTFVAIARRAGQFRGESKLSTWIYRIATNACHDLARKRARRPSTPIGDIVEAVEDSREAAAEDALAGLELAMEVQQALLALDELSRTLLIMCAVEGLPYAEVAAAMDLPVGTVKSRVFRARARLAGLLSPTAGDAAPPSASPVERPHGPRTPAPGDPRGPP